MKPKHVLCTLLFCSAIFTSYAQPKAVSIQAIRKVLNAQVTAWNEGNIEHFMQGYWNSDSLTFIGKSGIRKGWHTVLANYKKNYPDKKTMGVLTFDNIETQLLSADAAFVTGKWHLQRQADTLHGYFTLLWKQLNGRWVIVSDHSS